MEDKSIESVIAEIDKEFSKFFLLYLRSITIDIDPRKAEDLRIDFLAFIRTALTEQKKELIKRIKGELDILRTCKENGKTADLLDIAEITTLLNNL